MSIKVVLFDLDGTLLPMEQETFAKTYVQSLALYLTKYGYEPKDFARTLWAGTAAMVKNDGAKSNEEVFWATAQACYGKDLRADSAYFDEFYATEFDKVKEACGYTPKAAELIVFVKEKGYRAALATNPIFPAIATRKRMVWAGLSEKDFEVVTTYENSFHCKPNIAYYQEILQKLGVKAEECLMVGNDVNEDMVAANLGMKVFLLTDCLINREGKDSSVYPHGSFETLKEFIENLA